METILFHPERDKNAIQEAAAILSDPSVDTPIKAVASGLGFTSISTFYRLFQAIKGTSPSQYRKQFSN